MRSSLVVLDADRRRHRHALQHLQHHTRPFFLFFFFFDVLFISGTLTWRNAVTLPYYRQLQAHMPGRQRMIS